MMKRSNLYLFIAFLLIILVVIFFYPKTSKIINDSYTGYVSGQYKSMFCDCAGLTFNRPGLTKSGAYVQLCLGLPINCRYECNKRITAPTSDGGVLEKWLKISCEKYEENSVK